MASARNYWTDRDLEQDAKWNRSYERYCRGKAELDPYYWLRKANTAKLRAEASEAVLARRKSAS